MIDSYCRLSSGRAITGFWGRAALFLGVAVLSLVNAIGGASPNDDPNSHRRFGV